MDISTEKLFNENCWYKDVCENRKCDGCIQYEEMEFLMTSCNLPKAKQRPIKLSIPNKDVEAYKRLGEIKQDIYNFVQDGKNLYIGSEKTGTGKTSWAIKLMHNYFDCVWKGNCLKERAVFVHVPTFLLKQKDFNNYSTELRKLCNLIKDVDLVVWDDIAGAVMSAYDTTQLLSFIDYRMLSEYSNIFTSNFADRDLLIDVLGERLASRVWSKHNTEIIIFKGGDVR